MSIAVNFFDALLGRRRQIKAPATGAPLPTDMVDFLRERRALMMERDCFKAELLLLGYTERSLRDRVTFYVRQIKAQVKAS